MREQQSRFMKRSEKRDWCSRIHELNRGAGSRIQERLFLRVYSGSLINIYHEKFSRLGFGPICEQKSNQT